MSTKSTAPTRKAVISVADVPRDDQTPKSIYDTVKELTANFRHRDDYLEALGALTDMFASPSVFGPDPALDDNRVLQNDREQLLHDLLWNTIRVVTPSKQRDTLLVALKATVRVAWTAR
jgi:hypothetical protein